MVETTKSHRSGNSVPENPANLPRRNVGWTRIYGVEKVEVASTGVLVTVKVCRHIQEPLCSQLVDVLEEYITLTCPWSDAKHFLAAKEFFSNEWKKLDYLDKKSLWLWWR